MISQEKNLVTIRAEIETEAFEKAVEAAFRSFGQKANIKGFRKGKVPKRVLEMYVGKEAVQAEALESLVPQTMREVINEYELDLIGEPKMELESMEEGAPVVLKFIFEVRPEITLPDFAEISVERPKVSVEDHMIEEALKELQTRHARFEKVEGRPAGEKDALLVDYRSWVEEEQERPEETQESLMDLSAEGLRPEMVEALTGAVEGEQKEARIVIDADYPNKELAGKTVVYDFVVKEVQEKILPELDDDFASLVSEDEEIKTIAQLRENIVSKLAEQFESQSLEIAKSSAVTQLSEKSTVEVPDSLVDQELEALKEQETQEIKRHMGLDLEEYLEKHEIDRGTFESNLRDRATRVVRQTLVLEALADEKGITIEDADVDAEMERMASAYNMEAAQVKGIFLKDADRVGTLIHRLRIQKTAEALLKEVEVREVESPSPIEEGAEQPLETSGE